MKRVNTLQNLVSIGAIISVLLICLHLLNKEWKLFDSNLFCLRMIFGVFIFNLFLLVVGIILWWLSD